jgi:hypothetical protein|eukprot:TRINITY_DN76516_c0_g1_i1.p1 TRINITY_DN76516_c0_g1~~TRINITY_DN76516_c0_g1_i1.p1  ORF type:complete len:559 (+),score=90.40 TRINITY_DN76516_c0_g1_i1:69-1679(+)
MTHASETHCKEETLGLAKNRTAASARAKVSLAFWMENDEIRRRKRMLSFKSADSLLKIYREISGHGGTRKLWPSCFTDKIKTGYVAYLYALNPGDTEWTLPLPQTRLAELVHPEQSEDAVPVVELCLKLEDIRESGDSDLAAFMAVSCCKSKKKKSTTSDKNRKINVQEKRTFLHVDDGSDGEDYVGSYAESAPGSFPCGSHDGECPEQQSDPRTNMCNGVETSTVFVGTDADDILFRSSSNRDATQNVANESVCVEPVMLPQNDVLFDGKAYDCIEASTRGGSFSSDNLQDTPETWSWLESTNAESEDDIEMFSDFRPNFLSWASEAAPVPPLPPQMWLSGSTHFSTPQALESNVSFSRLNVNCGDRGENNHRLFHAVMKANVDELEAILRQDKVDVRFVTDCKSSSVFHFWARSTSGGGANLFSCGELLLRAGGDVNVARTTDGMTPLHHAVVSHNNRTGWLDFHKAVFLVKHGASLTAKTTQGQTPLELLKIGRSGRNACTAYLAKLLNPSYSWMVAGLPQCKQAARCCWCSA